MSKRLKVMLALALTLWFVSGCNQGGRDVAVTPTNDTSGADTGHDDYNPHDVPITDEQKAELKAATTQFGDAVAKIVAFRDVIEAETKDGIPENPFLAHQGLDKADLVLQWLPQVARDSGVAKEQWEAVNTAANDLRTIFEQVHQNIDNQQDPDFASVAEGIKTKIAGLEQIANEQAATAPETE